MRTFRKVWRGISTEMETKPANKIAMHIPVAFCNGCGCCCFAPLSGCK